MSNVGNADAFIPLTLYILGFKGCNPFHHYSFIITNYYFTTPFLSITLA